MAEESREIHHHYHGWCCGWRGGRWGAVACGVALVVGGGAWLLANLGLITASWWEVAVPLVLVLWGVGALADVWWPRTR